MKNSKSIKILLILCIIYILFRLTILFTSPYIFNSEETRMGLIAKEIMGGSKIPIFEYQYLFVPHQGGLIINSLFIIPLFYIFGEHAISIKLLWLLTSLGALIILYCFLNKFFSRKVAILASLLFILSPQLFTIHTLTDVAVYNGAVFFTVLIMYLFYNTFFNNKPKFRNLALFSLICGFALYFELSSLVMIFTCLLFWFIFDKKFFLKKWFFIFILFFLIGFSPSLYYNFTHGFDGYLTLSPGNLFQGTNLIISPSSKLFNLLTQDLPNSFNQVLNFKENIYFRYTPPLTLLNYSYYLIFILSFIYLIYLNRKNILKSITGLIPHNKFNIKPNKFKKEIFILAYPIIFAIIYSISIYYTGPNGWHTGYRYMLPVYPFIFIIIALSIVNLLKNKNKIFRYTGLLISATIIILGIISNINLVEFDNWNLGDNYRYQSRYSGDFYQYLGEFSGRQFNDDITSAISVCSKIQTRFKYICFEGIGINMGIRSGPNISVGISSCNKFPIEFRNDCFKGLSKGVRGSFGRNTFKAISATISSSIQTCNKIPIEFRNDCFSELSKGVGRYFSPDIRAAIYACNKIPIEFRNDCFRRVGKGISWRLDNDNSVAISKCNKVPTEFRNDCFLGLGDIYEK